MQVTVQAERCVGAGQCVMAAPDVFSQDEEGVVVLDPAAVGDNTTDVQEAAALCPAAVIRLHSV